MGNKSWEDFFQIFLFKFGDVLKLVNRTFHFSKHASEQRFNGCLSLMVTEQCKLRITKDEN